MGKNNADSKYPARTRSTCGGSFFAVSALRGWGLQGLAPSGPRGGGGGWRPRGGGGGCSAAALAEALGLLCWTRRSARFQTRSPNFPCAAPFPGPRGAGQRFPPGQRLGSGAVRRCGVRSCCRYAQRSGAVPGLRGAVLPWLRAARGRLRCHRPPRAPGERGHPRRPPPAPFFLSVDENGALGPKGSSQRFVAGLQF